MNNPPMTDEDWKELEHGPFIYSDDSDNSEDGPSSGEDDRKSERKPGGSSKRPAPKKKGSRPGKAKRPKNRPYVEVEYETEVDKNTPVATSSLSW